MKYLLLFSMLLWTNFAQADFFQNVQTAYNGPQTDLVTTRWAAATGVARIDFSTGKPYEREKLSEAHGLQLDVITDEHRWINIAGLVTTKTKINWIGMDRIEFYQLDGMRIRILSSTVSSRRVDVPKGSYDEWSHFAKELWIFAETEEALKGRKEAVSEAGLQKGLPEIVAVTGKKAVWSLQVNGTENLELRAVDDVGPWSYAIKGVIPRTCKVHWLDTATDLQKFESAESRSINLISAGKIYSKDSGKGQNLSYICDELWVHAE